MNQAGLLKFVNNAFPLLNFSNQANIPTILWRLHSIVEILAAPQYCGDISLIAKE